MSSLKSEDRPDLDDTTRALGNVFLTDREECYTSDLKVPYHRNLKKALVVKSNLLISGFIPPCGQRFSVDLCRPKNNKFGINIEKEIVFHFNPRFDQNSVVRNIYINGEWGLEEVHARKKSPFKPGQIFIMEIYITKSKYLVSVNGIHFCSFTHRIHPSSVDSIEIKGDVQLLKVELSVREMYPSKGTTILLVDDPENKMKFPFYHEFKYPLMEMWNLIVVGTVMDYADRFAIDLCGMCDNCLWSHKNIIFHFNPRLSQNSVVRNSFLHEQWGKEELHTIIKSPFRRGRRFAIEICVTKNEYMVAVNGEHFCSYQHRVPPSFIDSLEIRGDVALKRVDICTKNIYPTPQQELLYPELDCVLSRYLPI